MMARARAVEFSCTLSEPEVPVVEAAGCIEQALSSMLCEAARLCEYGAELQLHDELEPTQVRLRLRVVAPAWDMTEVAASLAALGGDAGCQQDHDLADAWVAVPRA